MDLVVVACCRYDTNGSGTLDRDEFKQAVTDMGFREVADALFDKIPRREDGTVHYGALTNIFGDEIAKGQNHPKDMKSFMIALTLDDDEADLIDTSGWAFGGNDPEHARAEFVKLLGKKNVQVPQLLNQLDDNKNGSLSFEEFRQAMSEELGFFGPDYVVYEMFDIVDADMDGKVTLAELNSWVCGFSSHTQQAQTVTFDQLEVEEQEDDADGNDKEWSEARLRQVIRNIISMTGQRIGEVIVSWDQSGDGRLQKSE